MPKCDKFYYIVTKDVNNNVSNIVIKYCNIVHRGFNLGETLARRCTYIYIYIYIYRKGTGTSLFSNCNVFEIGYLYIHYIHLFLRSFVILRVP